MGAGCQLSGDFRQPQRGESDKGKIRDKKEPRRKSEVADTWDIVKDDLVERRRRPQDKDVGDDGTNRKESDVPALPTAHSRVNGKKKSHNTDVAIVLPKHAFSGVRQIADVPITEWVEERPEVPQIVGVVRSILKCHAARALGE